MLRFLLLILALCGCGAQEMASNALIVGGIKSPRLPFLVGLTETGSKIPFCAGVIIADNFVLTAAHCVRSRTAPVWVDRSSKGEGPGDTTAKDHVVAIYIHPDHDATSKKADIALLLTAKQNPTHRDPMESQDFADLSLDDGSLAEAFVAGWGLRSSYGFLPSEQLEIVSLPIVNMAECQKLGGRYQHLGQDQICAGDLKAGGFDSCQGDSGGPLFIKGADQRPHVVGIVSWGDGCAQPLHPGVYTRVSSYKSWIDEVVEATKKTGNIIKPLDLTREVTARCYDKFHSKIVFKNAADRLTISRSMKAMETLSPDDFPSHPLGEPDCQFDLPGLGHFEAFVDHLHQGDARKSKITVVSSGADMSHSAAIHHSVRYVLNCNFREGVGGNPALILDGEQSFVRIGEHSYVFAQEFDRTPMSPIKSLESSGCGVKDLKFQILPQPNKPSESQYVIDIESPELPSKHRIVGLEREAPKPPLLLDLYEESSTSGRIRINNKTGRNVVSWQLVCNKDVKLMEPSPHTLCSSSDKLEPLSTEFRHPQSPLGLIKAGTSLEFCYVSKQRLDPRDHFACSINTVPVEIAVHPTFP